MFGDRALAERHVRLRSGKRTATAAAELWPEMQPTHMEFQGCSASFTGDGSPLSQVNGFGFFQLPTDEALEAIRAFYRGRTPEFEVVMNPFGPTDSWNMVLAAGARLATFESVLVRTTANPPDVQESVEIEEVGPADLALWGEVSTEAFFGIPQPPIAEPLKQLMMAMPSHRRYLAYVQRRPAAAGSLLLDHGVAFLGGAAVLPEFRGMGIQRALIAKRLQDAAQAEIAFIEATPGSVSQRNAEQMGFKLMFQQASLMLSP